MAYKRKFSIFGVHGFIQWDEYCSQLSANELTKSNLKEGGLKNNTLHKKEFGGGCALNVVSLSGGDKFLIVETVDGFYRRSWELSGWSPSYGNPFEYLRFMIIRDNDPVYNDPIRVGVSVDIKKMERQQLIEDELEAYDMERLRQKRQYYHENKVLATPTEHVTSESRVEKENTRQKRIEEEAKRAQGLVYNILLDKWVAGEEEEDEVEQSGELNLQERKEPVWNPLRQEWVEEGIEDQEAEDYERKMRALKEQWIDGPDTSTP